MSIITNMLVRMMMDSSGFAQGAKQASTAVGEIKKDVISLQDVGKGMRAVGLAITAGITTPLIAVGAKSTMAAAQLDGATIATNALARASGFSETSVQNAADAVQSMGIEAASAQNIVQKFMTAQLDLASAAGLARVAQDQAVISQENSTETMTRLTDAIITGNAMMFRSMGMTLDLGAAYDAYAGSLGKTAEQLTETERVQARVNAVMEYGERIQGTYASAMEDSWKQMGSFKRYLNEIFVAIGQQFTPALNTAVFGMADLLKEIRTMVSEGGTLIPVLEGVGKTLNTVAKMGMVVVNWLMGMPPWLMKNIANFVALLAVLGPILAVGGQVVIWLGSLTTTLGVSTAAFGAATIAVAPYLAAIVAITAAIIYLSVEHQRMKQVLSEVPVVTDNVASSYEDYTKAVVDSWNANKNFFQSTAATVDAMGRLRTSGGLLVTDTRVLTKEQHAAATAFGAAAWQVEGLSAKMAASDAHMTRMLTGVSTLTQEVYELSFSLSDAQGYLNGLGIETSEQERLMRELAIATGQATSSAFQLEDVQRALTEAWGLGIVPTWEYNEALRAAEQAARDGGTALSNLTVVIGHYRDAAGELQPIEVTIDTMQAMANLEALRVKLEEDLASAMTVLVDAQNTWRENLASDLQQGLLDAGLDAETYAEKLTLIDDALGTALAQEYKYDVEYALEIDELLRTLLENPESFVTAAATFEDYFMPLERSVASAQELVDFLQDSLDDIAKEYAAIIEHATVGEANSAVGDLQESLDELVGDYAATVTYNLIDEHGLHGLTLSNQTAVYTVIYEGLPPGGLASGGMAYAGRPYIVGEAGPELIVPNQNSYVHNAGETERLLGGGGVTNNYYLTANYPMQSEFDLVQQIKIMELLNA